ncbi:hypothetical protein M3Y97_01087100 [Aphelenchoides bicaudatus]|nr:hypothetical protein M3Y97_01087100 [Aphelenchoides bicaudatus]
MKLLLCLLFLLVEISNATTTLLTQKLGISGNFLTTSVGIGTPPQFFELGIVLSSDKSLILDVATADPANDFNYNYIKELFTPEISDSLNVTNLICRKQYVDSNGHTFKSDGHYVDDLITLDGTQFSEGVRFCDLDTPRTADTATDDALNWFMVLPVDGFLGLAPGRENIFERADGLDLNEISLFVDTNSVEPDNSGVITFGGKDTTHCKAFYTFESEDRDSWTTFTSQADFGTHTMKGIYSTVFDLSAEYLVLPSDVYTVVTNYFGGQTSYITCSNYPTIPDLKLTIYGKQYNISIQPYFVKQTGSSDYYCKLNIGSSDSDDDAQIVLGRHLLDNYCFYIDYEDSIIGLAEFVKKN